jgi:D-3-phosphoglycerate dehydrogenase
MSDQKIVSTGPIYDIVQDILKPFGEIITAPAFEESVILPLIKDAIGLIVRGNEGRITKKIIDAGTDLKVIGRTGAGYDNVDVQAATARGIPLIHTPGANARAVAEGTVAFILALNKKILMWDQEMKRGNWKIRFEEEPGDLEGAVLGIIGLGQIGQQLAKLMAPFDMRILGFDPYVAKEKADELEVELVDLESLLGQSDIVSIHVAMTDETRGLINRERLRQIKRGAYLINMARGGVIESLDCLHEAIEEGRLAGVGLDVFHPEPPDFNHPIFKHPLCVTAPHALSSTPGAMNNVYRSVAEDMAAVFSGARPRFVVNSEVLDS